jgi:transposase
MLFDAGRGGGCCFRVVVTRTQLTRLVIERNQGKTISMCAMKSGMSRKTAGKYLSQEHGPEPQRGPRIWKTRKDPLAEIWPRALLMLRDAPELEAKALFEYLVPAAVAGAAPGECGSGGGGPAEVEEKQLRTFQRRVRDWRLENGPGKEVFFTQDHTPGKVLAMDWTDMNSVGITIGGRALKHKLFHAVLPYSNWEWAVRAQSESTLSLRAGLKATLGRLGRVPRELLSDHSSTATHQLRRGAAERGFNDEYLGICAHFGIAPRTINVGRPQENGSCESSHGHLKRRIKQHLLLRGTADFAGEAEYDAFLVKVLEAANLKRAKRLGKELAAMPEKRIADLADYRELMVSVGNNSTVRVNKRVYSVPCRLIGVKLLAQIGENEIVLLADPRGVISAKDVQEVLNTWQDLKREWRERHPLEVDLSDYDALLVGGEEDDGWVDAAQTSILAEVEA